MGWNLYLSSDVSAPSLTGQRGADNLINLLTKCLVTGYGAKTAAGWSKPFTDTNRAAFRMGSGRLRAYLRVDEQNSTSAAEARIQGFESMTGIDATTNPFASSGHNIIRKSQTADATARPWLLVADDRTFMLFAYQTSAIGTPSGSSLSNATYFGEFLSFLPNDDFGCCLIARYWENTANWTNNIESFGQLAAAGWNPMAGHYLARDITGIVKSPSFDKIPGIGGGYSDFGTNNAAATFAFPNPADGGLVLAPVYIRSSETAGTTLRGRLRGLWAPVHVYNTFPHAAWDTVSGANGLAGRSFVHTGSIVTPTASNSRAIVETSDTVERN